MTTNGMGAKHVLLVSAVVLLLTGATYYTLSSHGCNVSFPGRKTFPGLKLVNDAVLEDNMLVEGMILSTADSTVDENVMEVVEFEQESLSEVEIVGPMDVSDFNFVIVELEARPTESAETETFPEDTVMENLEDTSVSITSETMQAEDNMDVFDGEVSKPQSATSTEETLVEARPQRVMLETGDPSAEVYIPDPTRSPQEFVSYILNLDLKHKKVEGIIQTCLKVDGCGTVE